jgi:hypothetical protein
VETPVLSKDSGPNPDKVLSCVLRSLTLHFVEDEKRTRVLVESIPVEDGHQALTAAATAQALAVLLSIAGRLCPDHRGRQKAAEIRMAFLDS